MSDVSDKEIRRDFDTEAFLYATSKLRAAAVLSAFYRHDMISPYNLGFIGTAYTIAHEAMELLLKVYLRRVLKFDENETRGHDLGELFMMWDTEGRNKAEIAYQKGLLGDLNLNRILPAAGRVTLNLGSHGELLQENSPTVGDVVRSLDAALGQRNITWLCYSYKDEIKGFPCAPEVWYPEELLAMKWGRYANASRKGESLGLVEKFLKREGKNDVFVGWRYLEEMKLEEMGIIFDGPPAKMILIAEYMKHIVFTSLAGG